jgi:hypothetical protein
MCLVARIKKLDHQELNALRGNVLETFAMRHPTESLPPQNAYLPNYEDLKLDIRGLVSEANGSVSENRLRKLFYYTNKEAVDQATLQEARFGVDFLDACYNYISNNAQDRKSFRQSQHAVVPQAQRSAGRLARASIAVIILVTLGGFLLWFSMHKKALDSFVPLMENFKEVSLSGLENRGWQVLDYAKSHFEDQQREGYFTFHTLPGSYWTKPDEPIFIPNTLVHKLPEGASGVRVCFDQFIPYQNWQSIGIVIFDKDLNRDRIVLATFGYSDLEMTERTTPYFIAAYGLSRGVPIMPFHTVRVDPSRSDGSTLRLDILWTGEKFVCSSGTNDQGGFTQQWEPFRKYGELDKPFEPAYVGIFACQGWTDDNREPVDADIIQAYLDWVEIY